MHDEKTHGFALDTGIPYKSRLPVRLVKPQTTFKASLSRPRAATLRATASQYHALILSHARSPLDFIPLHRLIAHRRLPYPTRTNQHHRAFTIENLFRSNERGSTIRPRNSHSLVVAARCKDPSRCDRVPRHGVNDVSVTG
jgi:hypothetical protein